MKVSKSISFNILAFGLLAVACGKTGFIGRGGSKPSPQAQPTPSPKPTEQPNISPDEPDSNRATIDILVSQLQPESWFKNCLKITFNGQTVDMGCTKDTELKRASFKLDPNVKCAELSLEVSTFRNLNNECKPGSPCNGPYAATPELIRSPSNASEAIFFRVYDGNGLAKMDPLVKTSFDKAKLSAEMKAFEAQPGTQRHLRVFFEDQTQARINAVKADPSLAKVYGVDFNDTIFDVKSDHVNVGVAGTALSCAKQGAGQIKPTK